MQVAFGSFCFLINWLTGWSAGRENGGASRLAAVTACDQRSSSPYWARRRRQRQRSRESIQLRSATRCWLAQTLFIALDPTRLIQSSLIGLYEQGLIFVLADTTGGERNLTNLTLQLNWDITAGRLWSPVHASATAYHCSFRASNREFRMFRATVKSPLNLLACG